MSDASFASDSFLDAPPVPDGATASIPKPDSLRTPDGFLVFADGEEPAEFTLRRFSVRNKNGVMQKKKGFYGALVKTKPQRKTNYPRVVSTANPIKGNRDKLKGLEEDTTAMLITKKDPEKAFDQLWYEMVYGADSTETATEDSVAVGDPNADPAVADADPEDEKGKGKKKKKKDKKKKKNKAGELDPSVVTDPPTDMEEPEEEEVIEKKKKKTKTQKSPKEKKKKQKDPADDAEDDPDISSL